MQATKELFSLVCLQKFKKKMKGEDRQRKINLHRVNVIILLYEFHLYVKIYFL